MFSLFCEAKFWTLKNDVQVRNTDLGAFRYYDKKEIDECSYFEGKKSYCEQRGSVFILKNKRPLKLRDKLKELEQQLVNNKIVFYDWKDNNILNLLLNTGLIITIGVNVHSKDVYKILFDRFLTGKLLSDNICDVLSNKTHLVISYNENQLTLVNFNKPLSKFSLPQKLSKLEPKIQHVDLSGPTGRRLDRKLGSNKTGDLILTWWHSTRNELYPWSPLVKDEDRANIHVYALAGTKIELLCFYRTEFDLLSVSFSRSKPSLVWLVEQKVSRKGDVTIEYSSHEIVKKIFKKISITSIPLQTQICCHSISPDEEKLVLGCIDGSLVLFDEPRGITRLVKTAFIPNLVSWHNDGALIVIASERSQFQFFDVALSCLRAQLLSEDVTPSNLLDLAFYFKTQPVLLHMKWNLKPNVSCYIDKYIPNDGLLLLIFENGPLGVLNLIGGGGLYNDVQNPGLTPDTIIRQYLLWNQSDKALSLLLSLNWNTNGPTCLAGLYHVANYIFRHPLTPEREIQLEAALGSFYAPIRPLTRFTENEFGNQLHDLTRRFFHQLLRHQLYEKAYCLAIDLSNADLFVDLYHCAKILQDEEMAFACSMKVEELSCEDPSHSSCDSCSCSDIDDGILPPLPQLSVKQSTASRVPPLPDLNRHSTLKSSAFFNCNPTYIEEKKTSQMSNGFDSQTASTSFNEFFPSGIQSDYSSTQILTPEYPHSHEIRTSFSGQDSLISETKSRPLQAYASHGSPIENPHDLPVDLPRQDQLRSVSNPSANNFGHLKLKSQIQVPNFNKPFDFMSTPGSRFPFSGDKQFNPHIQLPRNYASRPCSYIPPPRHFNNLMMQRPLLYVPNPYPKEMMKPMNPVIAKQKVKFSETVTQIVVPDISKISIEDETVSSQHRFKNLRRPKPASLSSGITERVVNAKREQRVQGETQEEEENNGVIKVIHFGVV